MLIKWIVGERGPEGKVSLYRLRSTSLSAAPSEGDDVMMFGGHGKVTGVTWCLDEEVPFLSVLVSDEDGKIIAEAREYESYLGTELVAVEEKEDHP